MCGVPRFSLAPACPLALAAAALTVALAAPSQAALVVRKDAKDMTPAEKRAFVSAVLKLKHTRAPGAKGISIYNAFVKIHAEVFEQSRDPAHSGPAFLPWHRAFLHAFEQQLQRVSGNQTVFVPYWDWTDPASTAAVFSPGLMGGTGDRRRNYAVTTGPFRKGRWKLWIAPPTVGAEPGGGVSSAPSPFLVPPSEPGSPPTVGGTRVPRGTADGSYLQRNIGHAAQDGITKLPGASDMASVLGVTSYDIKPWNADSNPQYSFRCSLEGWGSPTGSGGIGGHNLVHVWTGGEWTSHHTLVAGTIASDASPNDPVFWLIHTNVDRVWAQWETTNGNTYSGGSGQALDSKLGMLRQLGRMIGDAQLASGTLRPEDLLDPTPWEAPYQQPLS
ncbi:MAG: putative tyrosinase [Solirubrobacteraceae bacterium]|nr:putative tyrosinase [Solirubrobacteraceae bacterium]